MKEGYIEMDKTNHIPPKFFSFTQELERNKEVDIQYIRSSDNVTDIFTKALLHPFSRNMYKVLECVTSEVFKE
jgi:hypothetical protein